MEATASTNLFDLLPTELIQQWSDYLDDHSRFTTRSVCKSWFNQIENNCFSIQVLLPHQIPNIIAQLKKYPQLSLTIHKSDKATKEQLHQLITGLPNLTNIDIRRLRQSRYINDDSLSVNLSHFHNPQKFVLPFHASITEAMPQLTYLDMTSHKIFSDIKTSGVLLPKLEVYIGPISNEALSAINPDTLTSLTVKLTLGNYFGTKLKLDKFTQLKKLSVQSDNAPPVDLTNLTLPNLEELEVKEKFNSTSTRLTKLILRGQAVDGCQNQTQLKSLTVVGKIHSQFINGFFPRLEELTVERLPFVEDVPLSDPSRFTKLVVINADEKFQQSIHRLINLRELRLEVGASSAKHLNGLSNLEKLTIRNALDVNFDWISQLTALTSLDIQYESLAIGSPINLQELTNLRKLIIPIHSNKKIHALESLTNLEHLQVPFITDNALQTLFRLTHLACYEVDRRYDRGVSHLTRLRELDYCFMNDQDIIVLTSLQYLTHLICRTKTCDTMHVTLLTRLQAIAVTSNTDIRYDWNEPEWSTDSKHEIVTSLLNLV